MTARPHFRRALTVAKLPATRAGATGVHSAAPCARASEAYISHVGWHVTLLHSTMRNISRSQFLKVSAALAGAAGLAKIPLGTARGQPNAPPSLKGDRSIHSRVPNRWTDHCAATHA